MLNRKIFSRLETKAMVFCRDNLSVNGKITYYPLYMAMFL